MGRPGRANAHRSDQARYRRQRCAWRWVADNGRRGVRLTFEDRGPGIPDLQLAMRDGYSTGAGLGLGLSGSKRLCHEFDIQSKAGEGTRVIATRWQ